MTSDEAAANWANGGYRDALGCTKAFEHQISGVLLDNAHLDAPLPQSDAKSIRLYDQFLGVHLTVPLAV